MSVPDANPHGVGRLRANRRPETVRLYAAEWSAFVVWCRVTKRTSLPGDAETLGAYLLSVAPGASRGTVGRKRAAIRAMHREHGLELPALDPQARAAVRSAATPRPPPLEPALRNARSPAARVRLAVHCAGDLAGLRDRALLLLVASQKLTGEEALGLEREQVRFTEAGADLRLPRATLEIIQVTRDTAAACPVRALEDWLQASNTSFGPVFRKVDRWGNVEHARLGPDGLRRIVARRAAATGRRGKSG